jgi:hypothetical protein
MVLDHSLEAPRVIYRRDAARVIAACPQAS